MRAFNYSAIKEQKWDSEILGLIAAIYKEAGKQELYLKQRPEQLEKLIDIAKVQSTEASNAIEGIVTTNTRIRQLVNEKTAPKNRDEQEIAGYRDALNIIHDSFDAIPITQNYILQLHKILYSHMNNPLAGRERVNMKDLESLPCLTYEQGDQNSFYFSEEILSTLNHEKSIKVTDKGTIIDLMTGTDGYTISSGICPSYLRGDDIISIPLDVEEIIRIGVITHKDYRPTALGQMYLDILHRVVGDMQSE